MQLKSRFIRYQRALILELGTTQGGHKYSFIIRAHPNQLPAPDRDLKYLHPKEIGDLSAAELTNILRDDGLAWEYARYWTKDSVMVDLINGGVCYEFNRYESTPNVPEQLIKDYCDLVTRWIRMFCVWSLVYDMQEAMEHSNQRVYSLRALGHGKTIGKQLYEEAMSAHIYGDVNYDVLRMIAEMVYDEAFQHAVESRRYWDTDIWVNASNEYSGRIMGTDSRYTARLTRSLPDCIQRVARLMFRCAEGSMPGYKYRTSNEHLIVLYGHVNEAINRLISVLRRK